MKIKKHLDKYSILSLVLLSSMFANAQESKINFNLFDGLVVVGYVDGGGFLNFTGPSLSLASNESKFILGMLPSLRFKEDKGITKNSFVTPNLGIGLSYIYKSFVVQIPLYYNAKSTSNNGEWNFGLGVGFRLNDLNKK
jgi:hypothetical protein